MRPRKCARVSLFHFHFQQLCAILFLSSSIERRQIYMAKEISFDYLNVMEPRMLISDDFKAIYINDAFVEKMEDPDSEENALYQKAAQEHPGYATQRRHLPLTTDVMKRYARLRGDSEMVALIERKEAVLSNEKQVHEMPLLAAFQERFLKAYPECRDVYKAIQRMDAYEKKHAGA